MHTPHLRGLRHLPQAFVHVGLQLSPQGIQLTLRGKDDVGTSEPIPPHPHTCTTLLLSPGGARSRRCAAAPPCLPGGGPAAHPAGLAAVSMLRCWIGLGTMKEMQRSLNSLQLSLPYFTTVSLKDRCAALDSPSIWKESQSSLQQRHSRSSSSGQWSRKASVTCSFPSQEKPRHAASRFMDYKCCHSLQITLHSV